MGAAIGDINRRRLIENISEKYGYKYFIEDRDYLPLYVFIEDNEKKPDILINKIISHEFKPIAEEKSEIIPDILIKFVYQRGKWEYNYTAIFIVFLRDYSREFEEEIRQYVINFIKKSYLPRWVSITMNGFYIKKTVLI
jgi:hypothetical protein